MPRILCSLVLLAAFAAGGCSSMQRAQFSGTALPSAPAPDFTLTDTTGAPWTLSQQHGKTIVLFFGYTHCADTCPATLAKLANILHDQHVSANAAQIAFVTIDPQRDSPPVMAKYLRRFEGAKIVGLTASPHAIDRVEHDYHLWVQKLPTHADNTYDDAHSSIFYLIDRNGDERVVHGDDDSVASIASDVRTLLQ